MSEAQQGAPGSPPAPPATATEASARLTALSGDKAWSGRLLSGDLTATKEFNDLTTMVAESGDGVAVAMSGVLPPAAFWYARVRAGQRPPMLSSSHLNRTHAHVLLLYPGESNPDK